MMKRMSALLVALMLCLATVAACAEVSLFETSQGLTIAAPADWSQLELDEEQKQQGYALMMVSGDKSDIFAICITDLKAAYTAQELIDALDDDGTYASLQAHTNEQGQEMVIYAYADRTMIGYMFCSAEGILHDFGFLHLDGSALTDDAELLAVAQECMAATVLSEAAAEPAEEDGIIATIADGEIELMMVGIADGPVFPAPANWSDLELTEAEMAEGCLAAYSDEANGRSMLVMASEMANADNELLLSVYQNDAYYATAQLVTNEYGQEAVLYVTADREMAGYSFVGQDGWLYNFIFSLDGGDLTQNELMTELVSYCVSNTYFQ